MPEIRRLMMALSVLFILSNLTPTTSEAAESGRPACATSDSDNVCLVHFGIGPYREQESRAEVGLVHFGIGQYLASEDLVEFFRSLVSALSDR